MKKQLLTFVIAATFLKVFLIPQFVSAQNSRIWGTFYGGTGDDYGNDVARDAAGNVYLAGGTSSDNGMASGGFLNTFGVGGKAFLVKFDANGNRIWATYYGDTLGLETSGSCVATDASGNVYLAGATYDTVGIASGGFQNGFFGSQFVAYLVKFDANGNRLWGTYYGGGGPGGGASTGPSSLATDATGNVYMAGTTNSPDSIASGGFLNTYGGGGTLGGLLSL